MENNENNYVINQGAEQYSVTITKGEYMDIYKYLSKKRNKAIIICLIIFITMFLAFLPFEKFAAFVFLILGFIYVSLLLISSGSAKKKWLENSIIAENRTYLYDVFDDKLSLSVVENHELIKKMSVSYENIKVFNENDEFYILTDDIQTYFIRKTLIAKDSILIKKLNYISDKLANSKKTDNLFVTFLILTFGLFVFVLISKEDIATYFGNPCYWLFFTVIPFSFGMIIVSLVRKKQQSNWIKGFIAAIVISVVCLISGVQQFNYNKYYNSGYNVISETEKHIGIEIPVPDYINFYKESMNEDSRIEIINEVDMEFSNQEYVQTDINYVEKIISYDVWIKGLPSEFKSIVPYPDYFAESEYSILYNVDTKEINTIPPESGTHRLVIIAYYYGTLDIIEYTINL